MSEFINKNVIVTGASSGIGQSVALYFLNCGAQVVLAGRDINTMTELIKKYKFSNATVMKFDLANDIHIYDFKTSIVERLNKIDIIVNCAGIKLDGDVEKTYPQDFDYTIDVNLRSVFIIIKTMGSFLNPNASIINVSCLYGTRPMYGMTSYCMSKAGLETLTRYAAAEFASLKIRVNAVTACPVETNSMRFIKVSEEEIEDFKKNMAKDIPLGRIAKPDDIVKVIAFLASERSSKITGQIIRVDGGRGLTSSGYVHYRGMKNMNARFEPDSANFFTMVGDMFNHDKKMEKPITDPQELKKFIESTITQSNFTTRLNDAHANINSNYKIIDTNDEKLKDRYLVGRTTNILFDKKQNEQGKMIYDQGQLPVQEGPEIRNSTLNTNNNNINNMRQNVGMRENYEDYGGNFEDFKNDEDA